MTSPRINHAVRLAGLLSFMLAAVCVHAQWPLNTKIYRDATEGGAAGDRFGVRLQCDGNVAVIGSHNDDIGANINQGSAHIYRRWLHTWVREATLSAADGAPDDIFGFWVAIEGDVAAVGAPWDDIGANANQGSVYVFRRTNPGNVWVQEQKLTASDGAVTDEFGVCLDISGDRIAVGCPGFILGRDMGQVYVFQYNGSSWVQEQRLRTSDFDTGDLLSHVSIDGNVIIAGAHGDNTSAFVEPDKGSAYIFRHNGTSWVQEQKLLASDGTTSDWFGFSTWLDGNVAVVGAINDDVGANANQGSAYVFRFNGSTWTEEQKLTAPDGLANDLFSYGVCIKGTQIAVGAIGANIGVISDQGAAYTWRYSGGVWGFDRKYVAPDGIAGDNLGISVSVTTPNLLVGAQNGDISLSVDQGAVYTFAPINSADEWAGYE